MMVNHYHPTHPLVSQALEKLAQQLHISCRQASRQFVAQDDTITPLVWQEINRNHPGKYGTVDYCPICKQFSLWEATRWERDTNHIGTAKVNSAYSHLVR